MTKEELEKEAEGYREKGKREGYYLVSQEMEQEELDYIIDETFKDGAEFGYNKAKEEMQKQDYSLFDFVMQYENGKFKCKYKSGKVFESVDGETWKENYNSKRERIKVEK